MPKYGWKRDKYDDRDSLYKLQPKSNTPLPVRIDLTPWCSSVEDQGDLGSCTANALVGALEYLEKRKTKTYSDYSRLFIYYNERDAEGNVDEDSGAQIRTGIKTLVNKGACLEKDWPYDIEKFTEKPTDECYSDALHTRITTYHRLGHSLDEMRHCLASGFPFTVGFTVFEDMESPRVMKTGVVYLPRVGEQEMGGHAVLVVGYNDNVQRFIVRNSWGSDWAKGGYFSLPYDYLTNPKLADDMWVIQGRME